MSTTPTGRPTPAGIEWATAGPDRWEWLGYWVKRETMLFDLQYFQTNIGPAETLEEAKRLCEEHYQRIQTTTP